ncbi:CDCA2 protein, partial [Atrichornis clamosus]|nr:CDCA2 protein [Atrichornis clamosus]
SGDTGSDVFSDLNTKKVGFVEEPSLGMFDGSQAPVTPLRIGNIPINDLTLSSSLLRSILKKTPMKQPMDSPKVGSVLALRLSLKMLLASTLGPFHPHPAALISFLLTEPPESHSSQTPKKKKVTFGELLSPEIFDQALPANTPLRRGASPACPLVQSPCARPGLPAEPLPLLHLEWEDECVEPQQELLGGSVAAEAPSPVENAEAAETDKPDVITTRSSAKRKVSRAVSELPDGSSSGAPSTKNEKDTKNPRKDKIQRQKNPTSSVPK